MAGSRDKNRKHPRVQNIEYAKQEQCGKLRDMSAVALSQIS